VSSESGSYEVWFDPKSDSDEYKSRWPVRVWVPTATSKLDALKQASTVVLEGYTVRGIEKVER
jgi:hypothetical protein